jgi:hypothetical protein
MEMEEETEMRLQLETDTWVMRKSSCYYLLGCKPPSLHPPSIHPLSGSGHRVCSLIEAK